MEIEDFLENCLNVYEEKIEDTLEDAKSAAELEKRHISVKEEILNDLPSKWKSTSGSPNLPTHVREQLIIKLESTFKKLMRSFEKAKEREKSKMNAMSAGQEAISYYNDQMDKYFMNHPNASTKEIEMVHAKVSNAALNLARSKVVGESNTQLIIYVKKEIEGRRKHYIERAEIIQKSNKDPAIGIDLGTTMCCVMVFYKGKCTIVPNREQGNAPTTPSYVTFHEDGTDDFGYSSKEEAYRYPEHTIYDAKRMIGRNFNDPKIQDDLNKWPFEVVHDSGNVKIKTWDRLRFPHEVSARLLVRFRILAEDYLGLPRGSIKKAVITVPAYFTEPQRRATNEAATCAGLQVLNILSEPTAAAIAYSWERRDKERPRRALIYDLGGGTFDVAIAKVSNTNVEILGVDGDTHLGGQDFDQLLMDHFVKEFQRKHNIDLSSLRNSSKPTEKLEARTALTRLKLQCEKAKERLTTADETTVEIQKLYGDIDFQAKITKAKMEELVKPLVKTTIDIVDRAISEAKSKGIQGKGDIDDVILVGGSSRMALVAEMVQGYFEGKQLCKHINPDEAIAYGAAIQAAIMNKVEEIVDIKVQDVTPMTLGVNIVGDRFSILVPKNSKIPCQFDKVYCTIADNQTCIYWGVYQGENPVASKNKKLGGFEIAGIPPKPKGEETANVKMEIDAMGILHVVAVSSSTGKTSSITISADRIGMDKDTMDIVTKECKNITTAKCPPKPKPRTKVSNN